ncbi:MAG: hypothetical protein CL793_07230 [Chloroflexi bacterium]|nr:hypothetical protein [Chloroflexota bacterium]|tara:strand:+ start:12029 stop:12415 length:387 start_codon:yes stop_codon:yes gene_type:complete
MITLYNNNRFAAFTPRETLIRRFWSPQSIYDSGNRLKLIKSENGYIIQAPVPGIEKDALDITLNENNRTLTIKGDAENVNYEYITSVPTELDISTAEATFNNGMIEIEFPRPELGYGERKLELSTKGS